MRGACVTTFYLGTPRNHLQAHMATGMPVLVSFAIRSDWYDRSWMHAQDPLLLDSGAYSELTGNAKVDLGEYVEWAQQWEHAVAWAGLDDINGDWRRSMENYKAGGFPTFHDTDPDELLDDLIPMALERGRWLGIGLLPPRTNRGSWLRRTIERIPDDILIHGFALRAYASSFPRFDSMDSTNWFRDSQKVLIDPLTRHLTPGEALEIVLKRYQRWKPAEHRVDGQKELGLE